MDAVRRCMQVMRVISIAVFVAMIAGVCAAALTACH